MEGDAAPPAAVDAPGATPAPAGEQWVFVCESSSCQYDGSSGTRAALARTVAEQGLGNVRVVRSGCLGLCGAGPAAVTYPAGDVYLRVQPEDAPEMAGAVAAGGGLARRMVRAPKWYRERIVARLDYLIQYLRRRPVSS
jgi:NADP-reducing hydrogenase subunit HndC